LKQYNSEVDWNIRKLRFKQYNYAIYIQSTYRQCSIINKRQSRNPIARYKLVFLYKNNYNQFNSTDISKNQQNYKVRDYCFRDSKSAEKIWQRFRKDAAKMSIFYIQMFEYQLSRKVFYRRLNVCGRDRR